MTLVPDLHSMTARFAEEVLGLPIPVEPSRLDPVRKRWASAAMHEELAEFLQADELEDELDALLDLVYFALGRVVEMGILPGPAFEAVHQANMTKRRGELSKRPGSLGYDAVKPEGWEPPDLKPFLTIRRPDLDALWFLDKLAKEHPSDRAAAASSLEMPATPTDQVIEVQPNAHEWEPAAAAAYYDGPLSQDLSEEGPRTKKVLVIGYARHGKDTVGEMLENEYGLTFTSSSEFCAKKVIWPIFCNDEAQDVFLAGAGTNEEYVALKTELHEMSEKYHTGLECFEDRGNHRAFWYKAISDYNYMDPTRLARAIFSENDVYCGIRNPAEFHATVNAGLADIVVWVDRSEHLPPEDESSCGVKPWMADYVIDNNGSLKDLERNVRSLFDRVLEV